MQIDVIVGAPNGGWMTSYMKTATPIALGKLAGKEVEDQSFDIEELVGP